MLTEYKSLLPSSIYTLIAKLSASVQERMQELRVRENRPLELVFPEGYGFVSLDGNLVNDANKAYLVTHEDCHQLLDLITEHSLYSFEEELKRGFITVKGGHRIGLSGRTVLHQGEVRQIKYISGFNFRFAKEIKGAGGIVLPFIWDAAANNVHHTLVISPPQKGKTTLLRDIIRMLSQGEYQPGQSRQSGLKVGVVDERSELAACYQGVPRFDLGPRTDVMDGCPKAEGMMMMIRSMSPEVLAADEIGRAEDALAIEEAVHAGIRVIASAHGYGLEDISRRPMLKRIIEQDIFSRYIILDASGPAGTIKGVYGPGGRQLELEALTKVRGLYD
jgi:stage III sporulation protein AA